MDMDDGIIPLGGLAIFGIIVISGTIMLGIQDITIAKANARLEEKKIELRILELKMGITNRVGSVTNDIQTASSETGNKEG